MFCSSFNSLNEIVLSHVTIASYTLSSHTMHSTNTEWQQQSTPQGVHNYVIMNNVFNLTTIDLITCILL